MLYIKNKKNSKLATSIVHTNFLPCGASNLTTIQDSPYHKVSREIIIHQISSTSAL